MVKRYRVIISCGLAALLLAAIGGRQPSSADPGPSAETTYEGTYVPLGGGTGAPVRPAGPTTERREEQIRAELARRGVTYEVDSSEFRDVDPGG